MITMIMIYASDLYSNPKKDPAPVDLKAHMEIRDIDLQGRGIIDAITDLIKDGMIPGMTIDDLYMKDVTEEVSGRMKEQIVLLGKKKHNEETPNIIYVIKKTCLYELEDIKNTYQHWAKRERNKDVLVTTDGYKLKLAWHERLFHDPASNEYYELLHAAQGRIMDDIDRDFFDGPVLGNMSFYDLTTLRPLQDAEALCKIKELKETYNNLFAPVYKKDPWQVFNADPFCRDRNKDELIDALKGNRDCFNDDQWKEIHTVLDQVWQLRDLYGKPFGVRDAQRNVLLFDPSGHLLLNDNDKIPEIKESYKALGGVLGQFFKKHNLSDCHHANLFVDLQKKVVTWIDLMSVGSKRKNPDDVTDGGLIGSLNYALKPIYWMQLLQSYGAYSSGSNYDGRFDHAIQSFFPIEKRTPELQATLIKERDILFNNIRGIYEAFANAFIENYRPDKREELEKFFRDMYIYPFNTVENAFSKREFSMIRD